MTDEDQEFESMRETLRVQREIIRRQSLELFELRQKYNNLKLELDMGWEPSRDDIEHHLRLGDKERLVPNEPSDTTYQGDTRWQ